MFAAVLAALLAVVAANDWPNWGNGLHNHRNSGNNGINRHNAKNLSLDWMVTLHGDISATPSIENGRLYIVDWAGFAYCLRESDGSIVWEKNLVTLLGLNLTSVVSRTTPALVGDRLIIGLQGPAYELALSKADGSLIWKTLLQTHIAAVITQSATVEDGVIYQGVSSIEEGLAINPAYPCCSFVGTMHAISAATGAVLWTTYMMPPDLVGVGMYAGCAVWGSSPPVDKHNVYIATGNLYTAPTAVQECQEACDANPASCAGKPPCTPESIHFDSVLALNKATGAIVWFTRLSTSDAWTAACLFAGPNCPLFPGPDYDFPQAPMIFGEDGLVVGQKSGTAWSLDRRTGAIRWSTTPGPGGDLGGFQWGSALLNDGRGNVSMLGQVNNNELRNFTLSNGLPWDSSVVVNINALNGHINWQVPVPQPGGGPGAVSATHEVLFTPAFATGIMYAWDIRNGDMLWSYQTNATLICGPAINNNRLYFGNGYVAEFNGTTGGNLYAFEA